MKKTTRATATALCALIIAGTTAMGAGAKNSDSYISSGEYQTEITSNLEYGGNIYLDLSEKALPGVRVMLDGSEMIAGQGRIINSVTYVPFRAFCDAMGGAKVTWDASTRTAKAAANGVTVYAKQGALYLQANDRYFYTVEPIANIDGTLFVPVRPMAKAFGLELEWDQSLRAVLLESGGKKPTSGSSFYKSDEVLWLSRIIHAESSGEPFRGKIAVGNVVLNRVRSPQYPNTIYGVIFDRKHGTQFSPVSFGTIYNTPSAESVIAAKICLEGYSISEKALFFMNPRLATTSWIAQNRPYLFTIGNHLFYS
ncbi:MAG: cell wall hydrolase [Clostridia bacterium]|nr:cell wall hydrolase [Clostridia bacterium]